MSGSSIGKESLWLQDERSATAQGFFQRPDAPLWIRQSEAGECPTCGCTKKDRFQRVAEAVPYKRLPLSVSQHLGLNKEAAAAGVDLNCSKFSFDDAHFEFSEERIEIGAPSWYLSVLIHQPDQGGTTYEYHLTSREPAEQPSNCES